MSISNLGIKCDVNFSKFPFIFAAENKRNQLAAPHRLGIKQNFPVYSVGRDAACILQPHWVSVFSKHIAK